MRRRCEWGAAAALLLLATIPIRATVATAVAVPAETPTHSLGTPEDEAAIRAILEKYQRAWNTKDAKTLGGLFAVDADFSSIYGQRLHSREVITDKHGILFKGAHKESQQSRNPSEVWIRFVKPDVACVDSISEVTNVILQSGTKSSINRFLTSFVFVKNAGTWEIAVFHNMAIPPSTPQPSSPDAPPDP